MPKKSKRNNNKANKKASSTKYKQRSRPAKGNFVLTAHLVSAFTVPAGCVRQVTIAPTPSLFNRISTQAPNFQSYVVRRVGYQIYPRFNLFSLPGDCPLALKVHLTSNDIPQSLVAEYQNFNNVEIHTVMGPIKGGGVPYSPVI